MKNLFLIALLALTTSHYAMAWQTDKNNVMQEGTIDEQFEFIIDKANKYNQDNKSYRVVRTKWLTQLGENVDEAMGKLETDLAASNNTISEQASEIESLKSELAGTNSDLTNVTEEKNNMSFLGIIPMKKAAYRTIMWAIIAGLVGLLFFFIVSFLRSNAVTKKTKSTLEKTRDEFDAFRKKSMEDELVLRRKLQTEINKRL